MSRIKWVLSMKRRTLISSVGLALTAPPIFALDALEKQKRLDDLQSMVARSAAKLDKIKRKPPDIVSFPGGVTATRQPEGDWLVGTKVAAFGAFANRASFPLQLVVGVDESFGQIIADYALTVEKANSNFINYRCNLDFGLQNVYLRFLQPEISNWATIRKTPRLSRSIPVSDLLKVIIS